ncbi:hypothetical protein D3C72_2260430 [compost metagenome]
MGGGAATSTAENAATVEVDGAALPEADAGAAAPAATARKPIPAQGTSAQNRPWADKGASGGWSEGAIMKRSF